VRTGTCIAHDFRVRVQVGDRSALRSAQLSVDVRRRLSTTKMTFGVRIAVTRLRPGRHRITVTATDLAGNRASRTVRFRRCGLRLN
jgi:hypothetical protein